MDIKIPNLSIEVMDTGFIRARESPRHRYAKILHKKGDGMNRAFNFLLSNSYMQPHCHPSTEKVEHIHIVEGKIAILFFDADGTMIDVVHLQKDAEQKVVVPAFIWHTYVVLSPYAVTYETMCGIYDPRTWKDFAMWAPKENAPEALEYLKFLKKKHFD